MRRGGGFDGCKAGSPKAESCRAIRRYMRLILTGLHKCPRCGLQNAPGETHCAACGFQLASQTTGTQPSTPLTASAPGVSQPANNKTQIIPTVPAAPGRTGRSLSARLGWRSVDGTVIHINPSYFIPKPRQWAKGLLWLAVIGLLIYGAVLMIEAGLNLAINALPLIIALLLLVLFVRAALSRVFGFGAGRTGPSGGRGGFFRNVASQFVGFFLTSRLLGQRSTIPVCDYRVRDDQGEEHLVRVEGYVRSGAMSVGDDVWVRGSDRQGTLVLRSGWNKRLRAAIKVSR